MKKWNDFGCELGRSMIEMLGVLAIVGILSVGGISAFQKAMSKHKINQVTEELSQFINELLRYSKDFRGEVEGKASSEYKEITSMLDFFVSSKWVRKGNYIYDSQGNRFIVAVRTAGRPVKKYMSLSYRFFERGERAKVDLCMAYYEMLKSYADSVSHISLWRVDSEDSQATVAVYGNAYCGGGKKCLKDLTLGEMREKCSWFEGDDKNCSFAIFFPI
ncbi:MAG: type II secretion system protein [Alphaproteobacteria bacterium]|nr:type II secretion system protein [Alphaproteobacteria bacterium]